MGNLNNKKELLVFRSYSMGSTVLLFFCLSCLALVSCSTWPHYNEAHDVMWATEINHDELKKYTIVSSPRMGDLSEVSYSLKATVHKDATSFLLRVGKNHHPYKLSGHYTTAIDREGNSFTVIAKPSPGPEILQVPLSKEYLIAHLNQGLYFKFSGDETFETQVPAFYVNGFLERVAEHSKTT